MAARNRTGCTGPVPAARLSSAPLPDLDPLAPPWPLRTERIGGTTVAVRDTPPTRPGCAPAVYVHGLGGSSTNWTDLAGLLAGHLDAVAPDLPGFGASAAPVGGDYRPQAHAAVLTELIERQGRGPVHLFGNSLGGVVTLLVAARRPDLVRTLTLISPAMPDLRPRRGPAPLLSFFAVPGLRYLANRYVGRLGTEARVDGVIRACFADPSVIPPRRLAESIAEARRHEVLPWAAQAFADSLRGLVGSYLGRGPNSLWAVAGRVRAPTLLIWGEQDRLVDVALAERTARAMEGSRLLVLPRVGHTAHLEAPEPVARAVLGFLEDTGSASGRV